jgi:hypothetical protein
MKFLKTLCAAAALLAACVLTGCANKTPPLYQWEGYQGSVDMYLRDSQLSPDAQVQLMESGLKKITAEGGRVPPGYRAHLGLLYAHQGKLDEFAEMVQLEKKQYPESGAFMDFLLRNFKK